MNIIKLGIIGTNFVSDWMVEAVDKVQGIEKRAVYSRTDENGRAFAAKHSIDHVYTNMEEFLSSDIDAVYIASPNFLHYKQTMDALRHGKHVIVEKPAALCEGEFLEMTALAEEMGLKVMEAMRPVHDPAMFEVKKNIPHLGTLRRAVFEYCQYSSRYDKFKNGEILNAFDPSLGNAALMDIGVYAVNCAVMFFGKPNDIYSKSVKLWNGMEGMGNIFLDYGEIQAEVVYSKITDSFNPSLITGEDGCITIGKLSTVDSAAIHLRNGEQKIIASAQCENNMIYEVGDFVKFVNGTESASYFNEITRISLEIMDKVRNQNKIVF